ncbi:hypothetical protein KR093_009539, partial [Drosophila rubida]
RLGVHLHRLQLAAKGREEEFLSNPLNCLALIRQLHSDWMHMEQLMQLPIGSKQMDFIRLANEQRPQWGSVEGALLAMHRIKESYELDAIDLAKGLIDGEQTDAKLSALECYDMGMLYYKASRYELAAEWFTTARDLIRQNPDIYVMLGLKRKDISYILARSFVNLANETLARYVLQKEPELSPRIEELLYYFRANIPKTEENKQLTDFNGEYARLCGSSYKPKPTRLLCSYKSSPTPFLRLAPFQMEQLSRDPDIFVFHNVISSSEIALLERATEPYLEPALVLVDAETPLISKHRTVRSTWLPDPLYSYEVNHLIVRIQRRIAHFTDLIIDYPLVEILKYGFGGHYSLHTDYLNYTVNYPDDRIATIVLYLSNVTSGGSTMFIDLDLAVKPEPGKALFWPSLRTDTFDFETRTVHASCPVKIGTK